MNQANGGQGIGGGVYSLVKFTFDADSFILFNHASTSGDNIGPDAPFGPLRSVLIP